MKRFAIFIGLLTAASGCGLFENSPSEETVTCRLVGSTTVSYKKPQISIALSDADRPVQVYASSRQVASAPISDASAAPGYWSEELLAPSRSGDTLTFTANELPVGRVTISVWSDKAVECGELFATPGTAEATKVPAISGIAIRGVHGDTDGDGDLDIVLSNGVLLINDGTARFSVQRVFATAVDRVALVNLDGQHDLDIAAWNRKGGRSIAQGNVYLSDGSGGYIERFDLKTAFLTGGYGEAALGDLDADGLADAVTVSANGLWKRSNQGAAFSSPVLLDPGLGKEVRGFGAGQSENDYVSTIKITDLDKDGNPDIAYGRVAIAWGESAGSYRIQSRLYSLNAECSVVLGDTYCPRLVDFFALNGGIFAPVAFGINVFLDDALAVAESSLAGTWFAENDFDGDKKADLVGFGETSLQGVGMLTARPGGAGFISPLFPEPTKGDISAVFIDDFDHKTPGTEIIAVSGHQEIVVYRQY